MPVTTEITKPITIDRPMVLIPMEEYQELLFEAGHLKTPGLDKEIAAARKRFKNVKAVDWKTLRDEIG